MSMVLVLKPIVTDLRLSAPEKAYGDTSVRFDDNATCSRASTP